MTTEKERFCAYCGASLGVIKSAHYDRNDTCGKQECERYMRGQEQAEREDAHEQLDRDMGY